MHNTTRRKEKIAKITEEMKTEMLGNGAKPNALPHHTHYLHEERIRRVVAFKSSRFKKVGMIRE